MFDRSEIEDDDYRKRILDMLQHHEQIWSGDLEEMKGVSHRIDIKPDTHPACQQPYCASAK